jgi:hypothetical protein
VIEDFRKLTTPRGESHGRVPNRQRLVICSRTKIVIRQDRPWVIRVDRVL